MASEVGAFVELDWDGLGDELKRDCSLIDRRTNQVAIEYFGLVKELKPRFVENRLQYKSCSQMKSQQSSKKHKEGEGSMILGIFEAAAGALICLIPGGQPIGLGLIGLGTATIGAGVIERDSAYQNDPNYVEPKPPF